MTKLYTALNILNKFCDLPLNIVNQILWLNIKFVMNFVTQNLTLLIEFHYSAFNIVNWILLLGLTQHLAFSTELHYLLNI